MKWKTQRNFSEEAFLHATFSEFVKCWGSGKRARFFVESMNGGAFVNFSTFLGNPGMVHDNRKKMAAKTYRHPEGHHDTQHNPHSGSAQTSTQNLSRRKSKRKTERENKRAADFQKKKSEEAERVASEGAMADNEEVAKAAKKPSGGDSYDPKTADKDGANTTNEARVSVINVADKTPGDNLHSTRNIFKLSFHENSDTDSDSLLNVDGNELLQDPEGGNIDKPQTDNQLANNDFNKKEDGDGSFSFIKLFNKKEDGDSSFSFSSRPPVDYTTENEDSSSSISSSLRQRPLPNRGILQYWKCRHDISLQ